MFNAESTADLQTTVPVSMEQKYKEEPLSWVQFIALLGQTPISDKMLKEISVTYNKGAALNAYPDLENLQPQDGLKLVVDILNPLINRLTRQPMSQVGKQEVERFNVNDAIWTIDEINNEYKSLKRPLYILVTDVEETEKAYSGIFVEQAISAKYDYHRAHGIPLNTDLIIIPRSSNGPEMITALAHELGHYISRVYYNLPPSEVHSTIVGLYVAHTMYNRSKDKCERGIILQSAKLDYEVFKHVTTKI